MSTLMEDDIKRWTAKRKAALVMEIMQGIVFDRQFLAKMILEPLGVLFDMVGRGQGRELVVGKPCNWA